jgi:hypothetical protein
VVGGRRLTGAGLGGHFTYIESTEKSIWLLHVDLCASTRGDAWKLRISEGRPTGRHICAAHDLTDEALALVKDGADLEVLGPMRQHSRWTTGIDLLPN